MSLGGLSKARLGESRRLMTQGARTSPSPPPVYLDFWTTAYQAIDD